MKFLLTGALALLVTGFAIADVEETAAQLDTAKIELRTLSTVCKAFKIRYDRFPDTLDELLTPPTGKPFVEKKESLLDPWGKKYEYDVKGTKNDGKAPDIWTTTPSKKQIGNWPEKKPEKK